MRSALDNIAECLHANAAAMPWHRMRYEHSTLVRAKLTAPERMLAPATINRHLCALRGVLKEAYRLGLMSGDDYHRARDIEPVRGSRLPAGRAVSTGELRALCTMCDPETTTGARDGAVLALAYLCGLRRTEIVSLDVRDLSEASLRVRGKGNRERSVPVSPSAVDALDRWLQHRGREDGPLVTRVHWTGRIRIDRLTGQAVRQIIDRLASRARVAKVSPHDMRRSFVSHLLDAGADIATVQRLAGHASITTTTRYDMRGEATKRAASALLHLPL